MKKYFMFVSAAVLALSLSAGTAFAAKIGYVDVAEVFDSYQKTKDQDMALKSVGEQKEKQRNDMIRAIRQLEDELALLSREAREEKQEVLIEKKRQLEDFDREVRRELGEQRNKVVREIFEDIDQTIKAYGDANAYDVIINERMLVYQNEALDVTQAVLKELAAKYKK